jgi:hypothetical protein
LSHWLDDAARGLSEGRFSRRQVLRRGGAVAGGALAASLTGSIGPLAVLAREPTCKNVPCLPPERCCHDVFCYHPDHDRCCFSDGAPYEGEEGPYKCPPSKPKCCKHRKHCCPETHECCGEECYHPSKEKCCHNANGVSNHVCKHSEGCCGGDCYDPRYQCCTDDDSVGKTCGSTCCRNYPRHRCCGEGESATCCDVQAGLECCGSGAAATCCKDDDCHNGKCSSTACNPNISGTTPCPTGYACCYNPNNLTDLGMCLFTGSNGSGAPWCAPSSYTAPATSAQCCYGATPACCAYGSNDTGTYGCYVCVAPGTYPCSGGLCGTP